ncbi:hypothetical protein, partial [Pantoea agglomerans]|uniref:hypothetical protein n=1 Tax=Enterobacter agglomerans TaxID=549 RepID=UPI001A937B8A
DRHRSPGAGPLSGTPLSLAAGDVPVVLIVQGARDIQIGLQDTHRLKDTNPCARLAATAASLG